MIANGERSVVSLKDLPNPLIPGFHPDPTCIVVDGTYFLVTSTFEYLPALPVYRSTDMEHWEAIAHVVTRPEQVGLEDVPSGGGVWAPTLRYHDGLYFVIVSISMGQRGCVVYSADHPAGPWSDGVSITGVDGIDPDLAWDDEGTAYITYCDLQLNGASDPVGGGIVQARADLVSGQLLEAPRPIWSGTGRIAPEGPHLYQRDGWWYLLIAEGGTGPHHAASIARSPNIDGPFEGAPTNPIATAAGYPRAVQSTGHADLVAGPDGHDRLVLLGTRAVGAATPIGRETYVAPVTWASDGWPRVGPVELRPRAAGVHETFDFRDPHDLHDPGWLAVRRMPSTVARIDDPGWLTIDAPPQPSLLEPAFVGRRQRHLRSRFHARVDASRGRGGVGLRLDEETQLTLTVELDARTARVEARAHLSGLLQRWELELPRGHVLLGIETTEIPRSAVPWARGGDRIRLTARTESGCEHQVAELDGRHWSIEAAAPFTGRVVGVLAESGTVRFTDVGYDGHGGT